METKKKNEQFYEELAASLARKVTVEPPVQSNPIAHADGNTIVVDVDDVAAWFKRREEARRSMLF